MSSYEIIFVICHMQQMSKDIKYVIFFHPMYCYQQKLSDIICAFYARHEDKYSCFYSRVTPGIFCLCHLHFFLISR